MCHVNQHVLPLLLQYRTAAATAQPPANPSLVYLTWKFGAAALANPNTAEMSVARQKLVLRPYASDTMPQTGAPTHMPAKTTLLRPDSSTADRFHSHLACRANHWQIDRVVSGLW